MYMTSSSVKGTKTSSTSDFDPGDSVYPLRSAAFYANPHCGARFLAAATPVQDGCVTTFSDRIMKDSYNTFSSTWVGTPASSDIMQCGSMKSYPSEGTACAAASIGIRK